MLRFTLAVCALLFSVTLLSAVPPLAAEGNAFNLTLKVEPAGKGTVTVNPPGPYNAGDVVTLTATPATGWLFDKWVVASDLVWWNNDWDYRVEVTANAASVARTDKPAEFDLNFTQIWASLGKTGTLDPNSVRVVEVDANDNVIDATVPFQFDEATDFNAATKAAGTVVVIMEGNTPAGATRRYHVYFDVTGKGFAPPSVTPLITFNGTATDEGMAAYQMDTPVGTYFYHVKGGGFSSFNDLNGNDWIAWSKTPDDGGDFRGIPNVVHPNNGGFFHPGRNVMTTTLLSEGPVKITFEAFETKKPPAGRDRWRGLWEVYPTYVTFTMLHAPYNYYFLYEGTPGGLLQPTTDFIVRNNGATGVKTNANVAWAVDIPNEEWAFVADPTVGPTGRALFMVNHTDDTQTDYHTPQGKMTILGFGRNGNSYLLDKAIVPRTFTWGIMDVIEFEASKPIIHNAYKEIATAVGEAETRAGASLGSNNPVQFTITGNHTITAYFKPAQFTLTTSVSPAGMGTVTKSPNKATYDYNEAVTLAAAPAAGWYFGGWQGDVTGLTNPITINVTKNMNVTALFVQTFSINASVNPAGGGSVTLNPPGPTYTPGTQVTVQATPNDGYAFTGWSGDLTGSNPTETVTVNKNLTIVANFAAGQYTFNATAGPNGTVNWAPKKSLYAPGEKVVVTATPNDGYFFSGWTGSLTSPLNPLEVTINGNTSLTGSFALIQYYTVNVTVPGGGGTVTKEPEQAQYASNTVVRLTAIPAANKRFAGWSGGLTGNTNPVDVTVTGNMAITATFVDDVYPLNVSIVGQGSVAKQPDKPAGYFKGDVVNLTATPAAGWKFDSWSGAATGTTNPTTIAINGATNVTATFVPLGPFTLTTATDGDGSGVIQIEPDKDSYAWGEEVTLTAAPAGGSVFAGWSGDVVSNDNPLTLVMDGDKSVIGTFSVPTGPFTDNFNACDLSDVWGDPIDPAGNATFTTNGKQLLIAIPATNEDHNIWKGVNNAPRVMQPASNTSNMEIVVKFDSDVTQNSQMQGILIEEGAQTLARFDFSYMTVNGVSSVHAYAMTLEDGTAKKRLDVAIDADDANYLRVTRRGDRWTLAYSADADANNWKEAGVFTFVMKVKKAGVFAGNVRPTGATTAPAHTAIVDYFHNTDGAVPEPDAPLLDVTIVGGGSVTTTPPAVQMVCGQTVSLKAQPGLGWVFGGWSGDATGAQNPVSVLLDQPRAVTATFTALPTRYIALPVIIR